MSLVESSCHVLWGPGVVTTRWTGSKPLYNNIILFRSSLIFFLFVCNLAWRPDRPLKPIKEENCQKGTPWRGREEGEGVKSAPHGPTYFFILSLDVMRFPHLFHHFNIALRVCILFLCFWCATIYVMTWHTGEYHVNERRHRASQCVSYVFGVFFPRWAGDRMSWAHMFRLAGVTQTYRKKIGMVLLVPKANDMCAIFLCQKKCTWQMT